MTIAAAMRCQGGVILCADSLVSGGEVNLSQAKIITFNVPLLRSNVAMAFAGNISHCVAAISAFARGLKKIPATKGPLTPEFFKSEFEDSLAKFYKKHMYPDPHFNTAYGDSVYLIAVLQNQDTKETFIFANDKTVVNDHGSAVFVGAGQSIARYIVEPLVCISLQAMDNDKVLLLADYMLEQVKEFVPGCGNQSHFFFVSNTLGFCRLTREPLLHRERSSTFRRIIADLFYASADLDLGDDLVRIGLHMTDRRIENIREEQRSERERRQKLGPRVFDLPLIGRGPGKAEEYKVRPSEPQTSEDQAGGPPSAPPR